MDLTASLYITQKGVDEVKQRVHKLGMKKRSVLILLDTAKSIAQIVEKSVFPEHEVLVEIDTLISEGFIGASGEMASRAAPPSAAASATPAAPVTGGGIELDDEIILSEAKFLLTDFSVDSFAMQSQAFVDGIRACKGVKDLRLCLNAIAAVVEKQCPAQMPKLIRLVAEINETA